MCVSRKGFNADWTAPSGATRTLEEGAALRVAEEGQEDAQDREDNGGSGRGTFCGRQ